MPRTYNDLAPLADRLAPVLFQQRVDGPGMGELPAVLAGHPRLLVIMNHGPALGPAPALTAFLQSVVMAGGGERAPFGVTWRGFHRLPGVRDLASVFTQSSRELDVEDLVVRLTEGPFNDCCIMPEGELCNVGNGIDVQPFLSNRFIEVAARAEVPILLVAHTGSENLAQTLPVPDALTPMTTLLPRRLRQTLSQTGVVSMPWVLSGRVPQLGMACQLMETPLSASELDGADAHQRVEQAGLHVRAQLQRLVNRLSLQVDAG